MKKGTQIRIKENVKEELEKFGIYYSRIHKAIVDRKYGVIVNFPFRLFRSKEEQEIIKSGKVVLVENTYFTAVFPVSCLEKNKEE